MHLISVISSFLPFTHFQFIPMSTFCLYLHVLSVWFYFLFLFDRATWTTVYMTTSMLRWWQRPLRTNRMRWTTWHGPSCTEGWPRTLTTTTFKVTTAERTYMYKLALMLHMAWKVLANLPQVCKHGQYNFLCLLAISLDMGPHYHISTYNEVRECKLS